MNLPSKPSGTGTLRDVLHLDRIFPWVKAGFVGGTAALALCNISARSASRLTASGTLSLALLLGAATTLTSCRKPPDSAAHSPSSDATRAQKLLDTGALGAASEVLKESESERISVKKLFVENFLIRAELDSARSKDPRLVRGKNAAESLRLHTSHLTTLVDHIPVEEMKYYISNDPKHWDAYIARSERALKECYKDTPQALANSFALRFRSERRAYENTIAVFKLVLALQQARADASYEGAIKTDIRVAGEAANAATKAALEAGEAWNLAAASYLDKHPTLLKDVQQEITRRRSGFGGTN